MGDIVHANPSTDSLSAVLTFSRVDVRLAVRVRGGIFMLSYGAGVDRRVILCFNSNVLLSASGHEEIVAIHGNLRKNRLEVS